MTLHTAGESAPKGAEFYYGPAIVIVYNDKGEAIDYIEQLVVPDPYIREEIEEVLNKEPK